MKPNETAVLIDPPITAEMREQALLEEFAELIAPNVLGQVATAIRRLQTTGSQVLLNLCGQGDRTGSLRTSAGMAVMLIQILAPRGASPDDRRTPNQERMHAYRQSDVRPARVSFSIAHTQQSLQSSSVVLLSPNSPGNTIWTYPVSVDTDRSVG